MAWVKEESRLETLKYKNEVEDAAVMIPFHSNKLMDYNKKSFFQENIFFFNLIYYSFKLDSVCRKIKERYKFEYELKAILSDLVYSRVLEPSSKSFSFRAAQQFLEPPTYQLHDVYQALSVLAKEVNFIQSQIYKNSLKIFCTIATASELGKCCFLFNVGYDFFIKYIHQWN